MLKHFVERMNGTPYVVNNKIKLLFNIFNSVKVNVNFIVCYWQVSYDDNYLVNVFILTMEYSLGIISF